MSISFSLTFFLLPHQEIFRVKIMLQEGGKLVGGKVFVFTSDSTLIAGM